MLQKYATKHTIKHATKKNFKNFGLKTFFENEKFFFLN
jgi:hypothetical protein